jgi:hypothetical protein
MVISENETAAPTLNLGGIASQTDHVPNMAFLWLEQRNTVSKSLGT